MNELKSKANDLEYLNFVLKNEMAEKKEIQQKMIEAVIHTEEKECKRIAASAMKGK
jgi:hypothetical protein